MADRTREYPTAYGKVSHI